jgi:hypothetical protein
MNSTVGYAAAPDRHPRPRWRRLLAHLFTTPLAVRRAFGRATLRAIGAAIELAEAGHSGEIVFVAEGSLPWSYLWRHASVRRRAAALFAELRVWDTERNNGVLIYVGLADRAVEIVVDRGAAAGIDAREWQQICRSLAERCRAGEYRAGAIDAVRAAGALLEVHFALAPGQVRANELPDRPLAL